MAETDDSRENRLAIQRRYREKMLARADHEIPYPTEKQCSACGQTKPREAFSLARQNKDGLKFDCRQCRDTAHLLKASQRPRQRRTNPETLAKAGLAPPAPAVEETPTGPVMRVPLTQGQHAVIDAADWPLIAHANWFIIDSGYAVCNGDVGGRKRLVYMHKVLLGDQAEPGQYGDHEDRNKLNNRRYNLRPSTPSQSAVNQGKRVGATSKHRGVYVGSGGRWLVKLRGKKVGIFNTEREAAEAFNRAAVAAYGQFAVLNQLE